MDNNELYHYGVLGMKWGRRKDRRGSSGKIRKSSTPVHEDYVRAHSKKSIKSMSDAELRSRINRLQMEKQYTDLSNATPTKKGKIYAKKVLKTAGTVASAGDTALKLYSNSNKIKKIIKGE